MTAHLLILNPAGVEVSILFTADIPTDALEAMRHSWANIDQQWFDDVDEAYAQTKTFRQLLIVHGEEVSPFDDYQYMLHRYISVGTLRHSSTAQMMQELTGRITLSLLEALAGGPTLLHAALLGDEETGRAVAFIGPSGRGKTTAARTLGQHYRYLSDETSIINNDLSVVPYPKPLSVIETKGEPKAQIPAAELGLNPVAADSTDYSLVRLVLLNRDEQFTEPTVQTVPLAENLAEVTAQSSGLAMQETGLRSILDVLGATGGLVQLNYAEIADTLPLVQQIFAGEIEPLEEDIEAINNRDMLPPVYPNGTVTVHRGTGTSAAWVGDTFYLFNGQRLDQLSAFAAECWLQAEPEVDRNTHFERMGELFPGLPEDAYDNILTELAQNNMIHIYVTNDPVYTEPEMLNEEASNQLDSSQGNDDIIEEDFAD
ncbi:MAG: septin family protein [Rothia sp. (in: high G+C Gram-positive bacteria)]|uniref:septin family protein n=1 Tax=Rothia sp. (in: high G+C Gram-positive bacteria) TaxID=1885016 RepID=UPI0026DEC16B|nr:septin family protein [Rothia sp. (in: high G+C Gram-positive bacteria)]MDO5750211.1 septin family protein [Rothia sp. (in: high G+C Gram-positive bacteria)]